jgi:hypothetical protein
MENTNEQAAPNMQQQPIVPQSVPNSTAVLVLGILSIVTCWCYGLVGMILGIIGLSLASKGNAAYNLNPQQYNEGSFKNLKAGRICSIIGLSLSGVYLIVVIIYLAVIGVAIGTIFSTTPWHTFIH